MNRFHVHLNVADLPASIKFYQALFGAEPSVLKHDYAKWMLEDPRINFAISNTGRAPGIDHLGFQVDDTDGLAAIGTRLDAAGGTVVPEESAVCCYAQSDKLWTQDPQGTRWETFHTTGDATSYHAIGEACATSGGSCTPDVAAMQPATPEVEGACCGPKTACC